MLDGNRLGIDWYERQGGRVIGRQIVRMLDGDHEELRYKFDLPTPG